MFKRFSSRARKAMAFANWFACSTGSVHITEDHIFAGVVIQDEGLALEVLRQLDISIDEIRQWYGLTHRKSDYTNLEQRLPTTKSARTLIDNAIEFCQTSRHNGVGTEHLLVAWLSVQNKATDVFYANSGLKLEVVKLKVLELLAGKRDKKSSIFRWLMQKQSSK